MTKFRALGLAAALAFAVAVPAAAQHGEAPESAAESRSAAFQAVTGPTTEDVSGVALLFGAYGTVLALMLGYVLWIARLQATNTRELERLRAAIAAADKGRAD